MENTEKGVHPQALVLANYLLASGDHLVTAESCTGGLLAGALTSVPGSSAWFDQGWITYTNEAKGAQLGVSKESLKAFGAVSEVVAKQMAAGALAMAPRATLALSTTGIAGPGGGSVDKPVGLVWFGFARRTAEDVVVTAASHVFTGDRAAVRNASVVFSIEQVLAWLTPSSA
jgi:nicotinamide-nucleotide amidase